MIADDVKAAIRAHAIAQYPGECCGLIAGGEYLPCANIADNPHEAFAMFSGALARDDVCAVVHSHPGASAQPSQADLTMCEESGVPLWIICSVGVQADGSVDVVDWHEFTPSAYTAPLIGCEFTHGINDCYGLVRRWYWQERGIRLPEFPRADGWWNDAHSDLYAQYPQAGFTARAGVSAMQRGDVLLMHIRSRNNVPNHAAVYLGGDVILHHLHGQLSRRDALARYLPYVTAALEYTGNT